MDRMENRGFYSRHIVIWCVLICFWMMTVGLKGAGIPPIVNAERPTIVPVASSVSGVKQTILALENWKSAPDLGAEFTSGLRTSISVPGDWAGKRIVVRFNGVADGATLWVNGQLIRSHWGSLMPWTADITDQVKAGQDNSIALGIDEHREGLNLYVRGRGMQNSAMLMALPRDYLTRVHTETTFDTQYKDATLSIWLTMSFHGGENAKIKLALTDPSGKDVGITPEVVELSPNAADRIFQFMVRDAIKWDAEHPNLYTLQASVVDAQGSALQTISKTIGLRQVEVRGNQMFINGMEVKLRGIWGGSVQQAKQLNANHTRQKWVSEDFLNQADKEGVYVLDENPVDFAKYGAEADPKYAYQWMGFITDMIERDRDHPSVIMWGLGNESFNGPNVLNTFKYAQSEDSQRPCTFSFANRVPTDQELPYSIYSSHYPNMADPATNLADFTVAKWHSNSLIEERQPKPVMPVLNDEYGHSVQNQALLSRDPNVRSFWGESLKRYWEKMFLTQGALGGDIFGLTGGFGSTNNELFLVRKAYSPIRIDNEPVANPGAGHGLTIPVKNWFDHTHLNEVTIDWAVGTEKGSMKGPDVAPHSEGAIEVPARGWQDGETVSLKFSLANGTAIDDYLVRVNPPTHALPIAQGAAPQLESNGAKVTISGEHFKVVFNKYRGLIENASYDGKTVLVDVPFLNLLASGLSCPEWWCDSFSTAMEGNEAVVTMKGNYAVFKASFQVRIDGQGLMTTKYTIDYIPGEPPPATYSPWDATSVGGYSEVGVSYMMPTSSAGLSWERKGLYASYPATHIGRAEGTVAKPGANGGVSDDFRATKEYVYQASVDAGTGGTATALSDGRDAVRVYVDGNPGRSMVGGVRLCINNEWNYPDIGIGNYCKPPLLIRSGYTGVVYLKLGSK